jgi:hypothetical protein
VSESPPPTPDDDPFTPPSNGVPTPPPSPFGPSQPLPGYPAAHGPLPGYPAAHGPVPGYPAAYGPAAGYPAAYGPPAGYALPPQYYASPDDPLVSRDIGGWWNRSLRLLQKAWRPLLAVHLISVTPAEILTVWAQSAVKDGPDQLTTDAVRTVLPRLGVAILVGGLLTMVVSLASQRILVQAATGRPVSVGAALLEALRRTPALIGWGIPAGLMVVAGAVCCIVPGLYVGAAFTVLPAIVLLERGNVIARSFQLLHADLGAALGRIVIYYAVSLLFVAVESPLARALTAVGTPTAGRAASAVLATAISLVSAVVIAPMVLTAYADMRARREPFSTAYLAPAE